MKLYFEVNPFFSAAPNQSAAVSNSNPTVTPPGVQSTTAAVETADNDIADLDVTIELDNSLDQDAGLLVAGIHA